MERYELEQWLCGRDVPPSSPEAIGGAVGLPPGVLTDTTFVRVASRVSSLRFTLAVLRDAFADDGEMRHWLDTPRPELDGSSATRALLAGRCELVETLAVQAWNEAVCLSGAA